MAKIEMDLSEYEAIQENKKLLENSLEKERELQEQIRKLSAEKTKVLEDAKMKVVKISRSEITEHILRRKDDNGIWQSIRSLFNLDHRSFPPGFCHIHTDSLIATFFEKITSHSGPHEEVTTHGLDEIKAEIREDLKAKMDVETKSKIQRAETVLSENAKLIGKNITLTERNIFLDGENKRLVERSVKLEEELIDRDVKNESIEQVLKNGYGFWNKSKILDQIISIINEPKK